MQHKERAETTTWHNPPVPKVQHEERAVTTTWPWPNPAVPQVQHDEDGTVMTWRNTVALFDNEPHLGPFTWGPKPKCTLKTIPWVKTWEPRQDEPEQEQELLNEWFKRNSKAHRTDHRDAAQQYGVRESNIRYHRAVAKEAERKERNRTRTWHHGPQTVPNESGWGRPPGQGPPGPHFYVVG
jgi:hypothetical protein